MDFKNQIILTGSNWKKYWQFPANKVYEKIASYDYWY